MSVLVDTPAARNDPFAQYGRNLTENIQKDIFHSLPEPIQAQHWAKLAAVTQQRPKELPRFAVKATHEGVVPVGILGGGMAGLYTALMLASLKVPFKILEATDRIGGRCYTYNFPDGGEWDYYDVGAMRFPLPKGDEIGPHKRLKDLFDLLGLNLFDYIYKTDEGLMYFNGVHSTIANKDEVYRAEELGVDKNYIACGVAKLCDDFINPIANLLLKDMRTGSNDGWKEVKAKYDQYSTRSYLQFGYVPSEKLQKEFGLPATGLSTAVINWMETFDKSSGWYDRALTETVLEALAFGAVGPKPEWHCIRHGTSVLPEETLKRVEKLAADIPDMPAERVAMNAPVTRIAPSDPNDKASPLVVTAGGQTHTFSHVISTIPLPNFGIIDTHLLDDVSVMQRNSIRQLQYGPSIKIGMQFTDPWWKGLGQVGGQSFTDLPVRTIVYPSYGEGQSSNVLIASYCWTNDAERLGNLIGAGADDILEDLVLRDLAAVHKVEKDWIKKKLKKTYSWNWNHNAWTGGAFAFFGPGEYEYLYGALNAPAADGRLQWAGELLSVRHAWIVGALDSAWAVVAKYLYLANRTDLLEEFYKKWGTNLEWDDGAEFGQHEGEDKGPGANLPIPHRRNLLLKHIVLRNPELVVPAHVEE